MTPDPITPQEQKVIIVLPAYNAAKTLRDTIGEIPADFAHELLLVDDASSDGTADLARGLGIPVIVHPHNKGYGGNQKTCYDEALRRNADIIVMLHPDHQYDARLIPVAVNIVRLGICDMVLGNRIRSRREAMDGGMPLLKYMSNRAMTFVENIALGQNLGECHSGFRVYARAVLERIPYRRNSDDFVFDSEVLFQCAAFGFRVGDIPMPVRYFAEASSINLRRSAIYALQTFGVLIRYLLHRAGVVRSILFTENPDTLASGTVSP